MPFRSPTVPKLHCFAQLPLRRHLLIAQFPPSSPSTSPSFHTYTSRHSHEKFPNHYETLGLHSNATSADIKKQFFSLSKEHHPDLHPDDPAASARFVEISEAYHILGSVEKRQSYDREFHSRFAQQTPKSASYPSGSHSSHSFGARPATGLSRRRTQFRGPPPSFYRSGGWGNAATASKRAANAASGGATSTAGGFSPGQQAPHKQGLDNDVPHWDQRGHSKTQEGVSKQHERSRKAREQDHIIDQFVSGGGSMLWSFFLVGGALTLIIWIPSLFGKKGKTKENNSKEEK